MNCPNCKSDLIYEAQCVMHCTQCFHEWSHDANTSTETEIIPDQILDSNGNILQNGDSVIIIKDLPVKGAPKPLKVGTKVKNIRLTDGDHNISCKIDGFGAMALKSIYVRKV